VAEVAQLVYLATSLGVGGAGPMRGLLEQHILARDPHVGSARLHIRWHIRRAHRDHADLLEQQLAVVPPQLLRVDPEPGQQVDRVLEQRAARHRDRQALRLAHADGSRTGWPPPSRSGCASRAPVPRSSPARAICKRSIPNANPTAGSSRPKRPSRSSYRPPPPIGAPSAGSYTSNTAPV